MLPLCLTVALIGVSYGVSATSADLALWQIVLLAVGVLGASSELLFVALAAAGANPVVAAAAGLLVNVRTTAYGMALAPLLRPGSDRVIGAHLVNDETTALATAAPTRAAARRAFWVCGLGIAVAWPLGAVLGAALGRVVPDPAAWGLDAVFPAVIAALALPALREKETLAAAASGGAVAVVALPYLAQGLAPVVALLGLLVVPLVARVRRLGAGGRP